jgi:hypothetical protein
MIATTVSTLKGAPYAYYRVENNYYREPRWAVERLFDHEPLKGSVHDPCCGGGTIVSVALDRSLIATGSDIIPNWGFGEVKDFRDLDTRVDNWVLNPPFPQIVEIVEHGLTLVRYKVIVLARVAFLEAQRRQEFFEDTPLARVWVHRNRLSCPPGIDMETGEIIDIGRDRNGALLVPEARGGTMPLAWFVWIRGWRKAPEIRRL